MSYTNHNTISPIVSIEQASHTGTRDTLSDSESLLGIYCQYCYPPQTPRQEKIAERYYLQTLSRELLPTERTAQCLRTIAPHAHEVELHRKPEQHTAHYRNLLTCGRVWFCPVCSAKITEARAQELQQFCTHWNAERGTMALVTYTIRHNREDSLSDLLEVLKHAKRKMKQGNPWQRIKDSVNYFGAVSTTEITYTKNGWHPHIHELWFMEFDAPISKLQLADKLKARWATMVQRAGGEAGYTAGIDYKDADTAIYSYISKYGHQPTTNTWSIDREVTKAVSKRARSGSRTPWQLLDDYGQGDHHAGRLFQEYAYSIKGRNQLNWSRELKAEFKELDTQSDEEIAEQLENETELFTTLTRKQWYDIINLPRDIRGELLTIAGNGNHEQFNMFLLEHGITLDVEF